MGIYHLTFATRRTSRPPKNLKEGCTVAAVMQPSIHCEGTYSFLSTSKIVFSLLFARFWKGFCFLIGDRSESERGRKKLKKDKKNIVYKLEEYGKDFI